MDNQVRLQLLALAYNLGNDDVDHKKAERYITDHLQEDKLTINKNISAPLNTSSCRMQLKAAPGLVNEFVFDCQGTNPSHPLRSATAQF